MSQQQRNSSFELLRIISMFLIVAHHYSVHSGFNFLEPLSVNLYYAQCLASGGKFGVNIFVLISGYFLCKSTFKWQKLIKLELQVLFYSIIIGVVFYIYSEEKSLSNLVFSFLPLYSSEYWFYKAYFVLFLLSPFLNVFINSIEKTQYQKRRLN